MYPISYKNCLFTLMLVIISSSFLSAQNLNVLSIEGPNNIEGDYNIVGSGFGLQSTSIVIEGQIEFGLDNIDIETNGCDELINSLVGKICFLDRGDCEFGTKIIHAENAGAIAVVVCNNTDGEPIVMGPGTTGSNANIYSGMISKDDCEIIRAELENNAITIKLQYIEPPCELDLDSTVVWGINGEGAFTNGIGEWELIDDNGGGNVFIYDEAITNRGVIRNESHSISSPTVCDGAIIADFDYFTTQGDTAILNNLTLPYPEYSGSITSPTIDLSNTELPIVQFYQFLLPLEGYYALQYSIDNGETWQEKQQIETQNLLSASAEILLMTEVKMIELPEAAGQSEVKIRFSYHDANFYFWMLDDISIRAGIISSVFDKETDINLFQVYPNPVNNDLYIEFYGKLRKSYNIDLRNLEGRLIHSVHHLHDLNNKLIIDCSDLDSGMYILSFSDNENIFSKKISVVKE